MNQSREQISSVLKRWATYSFLVSLISSITAITIIQNLAYKSGLQRRFFTYRIDFKDIAGFGSFAPVSIIPTMLAISIGLWWDALENAFRVIQPYASMSRTATHIARGIGMSYETSYSIWASIKAAKNKHLLLSLVTLGSFLTQTCKYITNINYLTLTTVVIIAMSAVFEQRVGYLSQSVELERSVELRQLPHIFNESSRVIGSPTMIDKSPQLWPQFMCLSASEVVSPMGWPRW